MENFRSFVTQDHPSFFQVFQPECNSTRLAIPRAFIRDFNGTIPTEVTLQSLGGKAWEAKVEEIGERVFITQGWDEYVNDVSLENGCVLIFKYVQDGIFIVLVFGSDECIQDAHAPLHSPTPIVDLTDNAGRGRNANAVRPRFFKTFGRGFKNFVCIPTRVANACQITLFDPVTLWNNVGGSLRTQVRQTQDRFVLGYAGFVEYWYKCQFRIGDKLQFDVVLRENGHIKEVYVRSTSKETPRAR